MSLVQVHSPDTEPELMVIVAMFEAHDIPCFVHNAGLSALLPGPRINAYNTRSIMVPEEKVADAMELLRDFQSNSDPAPPHHSPPGKLRVLVEAILFGWFVPGRRR
jgi:hypothetical protein